VARAKVIPENVLPLDPAGRTAALRDSVQRGLRVLQDSSDTFLANGFVKQSGCVSCHHQTLPAVALGLARERGFVVDEPALARQLHRQLESWSKSLDAAYEMFEPQPDSPANLGYGLFGLKALGYASNELTEAMVWFLAASQLEDGSFPGYDRRPPMEEGQVIGTAMAVGALRKYPQPLGVVDVARTVGKARAWLMKVIPQDPNQQVFRLLGLGWAGASASELRPLAAKILSAQRPDGGWAPLSTLGSDAWTTGLTLFVLHEVGGLAVSDARYRRGVDFLLRTQFADGSWWVPTRTWPLQPHFDSGFPHGKDQWISAGGTAWAVIAMMNELPPVVRREDLAAPQVLMARHPQASSESSGTVAAAVPPSGVAAAALFDRDIRPMLERSCAGCHSGEKPKGGYDLTTRELALKGGQSGEPAIVPGHGERSPFLRFVQDRVEDLEMPPLGKRGKFPALTKEETGRLRAWIDQGAVWPEGVSLQTSGK
jgi:N-acyl-D-amino-acid deacylase